MCLHTLPRHVYTHKKQTRIWRLYWIEGPSDAYRGFRRLHLSKWVLDKAHTCTSTHAAFRAQQQWWLLMWTLSSRERILISFTLPLSVSLSLTCPELYTITHSSYLWRLQCMTHKTTHAHAGNPFVPSFLKERIRILVAERPSGPPCHPYLDITCNATFSMCRFQWEDHYSLHCGCTIISAGINTKDEVHGIYNQLLSQVSKWQPLHPALSHRPQRGQMEAGE